MHGLLTLAVVVGGGVVAEEVGERVALEAREWIEAHRRRLQRAGEDVVVDVRGDGGEVATQGRVWQRHAREGRWSCWRGIVREGTAL